ncbi:MAG: magnesium/cobalt transporter CorA [Candidatus Eisenbacteria bacterium]|nr:magnesium/cobalt transporter CorA [Candidatus Eisenbacteria bacterium]
MELFRRSHRNVGLPPGTLPPPEAVPPGSVQVGYLQYDPEQVREGSSLDECLPEKGARPICWINIDGLNDIALLDRLIQHLRVHPLVLEDIVHTHQRPKLEDYDDYLYIVVKMLDYDENQNELTAEQMSLVLGPNYVVSIQEFPGDFFDPVRERIRLGKGRSRASGPDYLAYMLIDTVVDHYFGVLEKIGETIEDLEDRLLARADPAQLHEIQILKRQMIVLRRAVWPLREVVSALERADSKLIRRETSVFLRDVYDHTVQAIEAIESFRDVLSGLQDLYLSSVSNRLNQVMKVLTIIATIFIPLTFLAGVYGMNFRWMPELTWKWGYAVIWGVFLAVAIAMVVWFRRKKWM